ncbi:hypothetical protein GCM10010140_02420 [Streptosporangium pseudovulgare]|uniref:Uncharacterized protein n=2 Tax=Streptosporangium pseudovulgare TaxID=35765 RepID=A0ABQ2QER1_9ACTN|nr:hypothetical protein GCM10010140_02420 [Streptosporangium pseudovulgare]
MSPRRGDRAAPPPRGGEWTLRFENSQAADDWEMLCKQAPGNTRRAWDEISADPRPTPSHRHHPLHHDLATVSFKGRVLDQWQYEVTGGGRVWYLIDDTTRTAWITYASPAHPRATDR